MYEVSYNRIYISTGRKVSYKAIYKTKIMAKLEAWLLKTQIGVTDVNVEKRK